MFVGAHSGALLARRAQAVSVFARIRPKQKLHIVERLNANGETMAMSGDTDSGLAALDRRA